MTTEQAVVQRLKEFNLTTEPWKVKKVVNHLINGGRLSAMYKVKPSIVSQKTAEKIRDLYENKSLEFMVQELARANEEDNPKAIEEWLTSDAIKGGETILETRDDPLRFARLHMVQVMEDGLTGDDWTIDALESYGIPTDKALELLRTYDITLMDRQNAVINSQRDSKTTAYMANFPTIKDYMLVNLIVKYAKAHNDAPYPYILLGAELTTRGMIEADNSLAQAGNGIIRYSIWRSQEHKDTYLETLNVFRRTESGRKVFYKHMNDMLTKVEQEVSGEVNPYMTGYLTRRTENAVTRRYGRNG